MDTSAWDNLTLYQNLSVIRRFEETVLENFPRGVFPGTTHTYIGQEANAVGVLHHCQANDIVVSNHRSHGHFIAYGGDLRALFAELMGKASGVCGGRGGSQHLHWKSFYSNGILGGTTPIATGMALAEKCLERRTVTFNFIGDGTMGQGILYEALNLASLLSVPILFVVENNQIAQTTPIEKNLAGEISDRFKAFGIPVFQLHTSDVLDILPVAGEIITKIREDQSPRALIIKTYRFSPHSKGDDTRPLEYLAQIRHEHDPLTIHGKRLSSNQREQIEMKVKTIIEGAFYQALQDPFPIPDYL